MLHWASSGGHDTLVAYLLEHGAMANALDELGLPCYHMSEVFRLKAYDQWIQAGEGKAVDWEGIFKGHEAVVDFPASVFYKELLEVYPDAKVILTVRSPESWYRSMYDTIWAPDS